MAGKHRLDEGSADRERVLAAGVAAMAKLATKSGADPAKVAQVVKQATR